MKFIWTANDIQPGALVAKRNNTRPIALDHIKIVGYLLGTDTNKKYVIVSLVDGCVYDKPRTLEELATEMTEREYEPLTFPQIQACDLLDQHKLRICVEKENPK